MSYDITKINWGVDQWFPRVWDEDQLNRGFTTFRCPICNRGSLEVVISRAAGHASCHGVCQYNGLHLHWGCSTCLFCVGSPPYGVTGAEVEEKELEENMAIKRSYEIPVEKPNKGNIVFRYEPRPYGAALVVDTHDAQYTIGHEDAEELVKTLGNLFK